MKINRLIMGGVLVAGSATLAQADVSWEHTLTLRLSSVPVPLAQAKMYNNWTPQRHRMLFKYSVPSQWFQQGGQLYQTGAAQSNKPSYNLIGAGALVQRLDDDRMVTYLSSLKSYMQEPRREILEKARLNVWKGIDSDLAEEPPPTLTPAQRRRLGAEVRALAKPLLRDVVRTYFRPLPRTRVLNGHTARGYRLTWLLNTNTDGSENGWLRMNFEWWLAPRLPGDEEIGQFNRSANEIFQQKSWPTTSMWLNEMQPVLFQMLPKELHQAIATLVTSTRSGQFSDISGTPLRLYMTVDLPEDGIDMGDLRAEVALTDRNTRTLSESVWTAPAGYKRVTRKELEKEVQKTMESEPVKGVLQELILKGKTRLEAE